MDNASLTQAAETALTRLSIRRRSPCPGWYFCRLPNGITFNLRISGSTVRLWRYVGTVSAKSWHRCMARLSALRELFPFRVEITPDGCVSLAVQDEMDDNAAFPALLEGFAAVITLDRLRPASVY